MSKFKLGRRAIKTDSRTLMFAKYATSAMPDPPTAVDWTKGITTFGMALNDTLGDCTIAACAHAVQIWTANCYSESTVPDAAVLAAYEAWDGYNPADPSSDQGGIELDVLKDFKKYGLAGHHILGFADPNPKNRKEIQQSIAYFGGVYIGVSLPLTAQNQDVWDVVPDPGDGSATAGSWGGHAVFVPAYEPDHLKCITWGGVKTMTNAFWDAYVDEAHTPFGAGWIKNGKTPSGFDQAQLLADLAAIR